MAAVTVRVHYHDADACVDITDDQGRTISVVLDNLAVAMPLLMAVAETRHSARVLRDA